MRVNPASRSRAGLLLVLAAATTLLVIGAAAILDSIPQPSSTPTVDGLPVRTVSEALAAHAGGLLPDGRAAVRGWWSSGAIAHMCGPAGEPTGELELWCVDGEFGITELNEPIMLIDPSSGFVTYEARGPHLTPFIPDAVEGSDIFISKPRVNGRPNPPVPILVLGHFDDARAGDCRVAARELCRDRLVLDRIVYFGID